jgi:hypothetical protein
MRVIRQGDVVLISTDEPPEDAKPVDAEASIGNITVAPGSVIIHGETGHRHVLQGVSVYTGSGRVYVVVREPTVLRHEEHPSVEVPPGIYVVTHVQDYALSRSVD